MFLRIILLIIELFFVQKKSHKSSALSIAMLHGTVADQFSRKIYSAIQAAAI